MTSGYENIRILIADDHMMARQIVSAALREKNISQIDTAADGKKAREMIDVAQAIGNPYHIVFLDWEMPVLPGIEVLSFFRHQPEFDKTAFIMVTAVSERTHILEAIKAGATSYVIKPVSQNSISKKFDEAVLWLKQQQAL